MLRFALLRIMFWASLSAAGISITWKLWQLTGQAWWLVAAGLGGIAVGIASAPIAGLLADKPNRKLTLSISLGLGALAYLAAGFTQAPTTLLLLALLGAALLSPSSPAFMAHLLSVNFAQGTAWALGRITSAEAAGMVSGTLIAAALISQNSQLPFTFAAAGLAAGAVLAIILPATNKPQEKPRHKEDLWAGLRILKNQPVLRLILGAGMFMAISRQLAIIAEAPLVSALGGAGTALAIISAAWSVGTIVGGPIAGRLVKPGRELNWLLGSRFVASVGMASLALSAALWQPALAYLICGLAWAAIPVAANLLITRYSPEHQRGRLIAAQSAIVQSAQAAGMLLAGIAIGAAGAKGSFLLAGLAGLISLPWILKAMRAEKLQSSRS